MNIITAEMQYQSTFFIVPQVTVRLGKSWNVSLNWLNFELEVKHISTALNDTNIFIHTPYVTLTSYMQSAYHLTFDLCWLGYTYRKGIWLKDGEEPRPADNTPGFVPSGWFAQFRKDSDPMADIEQIFAGLRDALTKIKEEMEKLFQVIKYNGYKWNEETKTLEKLVEPTTPNILLGALATFGAEHQRMMCMEECAELIDALAKYDRGRAEAKDVITELADVSIMVEQMAILFGKEEFEREKERKLKRLQEKIDESIV